jgi:hypothetical protein
MEIFPGLHTTERARLRLPRVVAAALAVVIGVATVVGVLSLITLSHFLAKVW